MFLLDKYHIEVGCVFKCTLYKGYKSMYNNKPPNIWVYTFIRLPHTNRNSCSYLYTQDQPFI